MEVNTNLEEILTCTPLYKKYPDADNIDAEADFCIVRYRREDTGEEFTAKGALLPYGEGSKVTLSGTWETERGEAQLVVADFKVHQPENIQTLRRILSTMPYLDGNAVVSIINDHGLSALAVLDRNPDSLKTYCGSKAESDLAVRGYMLRRTKREAFMYLRSFKVQTDQAIDIALAIPSLDALKSNPYDFSISTPLSFGTAKKIAKKESVEVKSLSGAMASIIDVLKKNEGVGHTYCKIDGQKGLLAKSGSQIGLLASDELMRKALIQLLKEGICLLAQEQYVYRKETAQAEYGIALELKRLNSVAIPQEDYKNDIQQVAYKDGIRLAPEQINAVKVALNNPVTLLIGGPGTGKTTIERVILKLYRKFHPGKNVMLVAPTGKAACRMSESTGELAFTVHKALGITAGTEVLTSDTVFDAGLVLVDEASMLGGQETWALLKAIPTGAQVVIVGDTNQLPSVGAGNVLYEMIESGAFAIARLVTVYRQKAGSTIALNCAKIKTGKTELDYDPGNFLFVPADTQEAAVKAIMDAIDGELRSGLTMEDVCLLSPYRQTTLTGTDAMNPVIQNRVSDKTLSISYGKKIFYINDKVMYRANKNEAVNGDIGFIVDICGKEFSVDYGDGRVLRYKKGDLKDFDLAYAITIHKSQGSEYKTCIIVLMNDHEKMLKRNLFYTAVSRAKNKVILIGQMSALELAVATEDVSVRRSRLAYLIKMNQKVA